MKRDLVKFFYKVGDDVFQGMRFIMGGADPRKLNRSREMARRRRQIAQGRLVPVARPPREDQVWR